jgi:hypothetical protein
MADYSKVGPFNNGGAPGISASFLNGVENVFNQPSGGTETGRYLIAGAASINGSVISGYIVSLSRVSTPVSVSFDTSDGSSNANTPTTAHLTSNGFQISATSTSGNINAAVGGAWTIQF